VENSRRIKLEINFICRGKGINVGVEKNIPHSDHMNLG
jgi:hypothetical protein